MNNTCQKCSTTLQPEWLYCPFCGTAASNNITAIPITRQIVLYLVSFFLAPTGLWWGIRYAKSSNTQVKTVGYIIIAITCISLILMFGLFKYTLDQYSQLLNSVGSYGY